MASDELDELDMEILWTLRKDPSLAQKDLSDVTSKARGTVASRVHKLEELGYLQKGWLVSPIHEVFPYRCLVHIKLNIYELTQGELGDADELINRVIHVAQDNPKYDRRLIVEDVYETLGNSDLIFELLAENQRLAAGFILDEIAPHRGVASTITQSAFASKRHVERTQSPRPKTQRKI